MAYFLGLDVGGTTIKGIITDGKGKNIAEGDIPTDATDLCGCCVALADILVQRAGTVYSSLAGVGVCSPGLIDSANGEIIFAGNLNLRNYPLKKLLEEKLGRPVSVCNDANAAALGEAKFGAGSDYSDSVMITLGTGVGGGIVIGGKLFEGYKSAGAEIGHMVIEQGGLACSCGRRGCFEAYSSARALMKLTRDAMEDDTGSAMWSKYTYETADGRTAFEFMDCDRTAKKVVDGYLKYLACGIINLINVFRPEAIIIGGGVSAQGTRLTEPLQKLVDAEIFGGTDYAPVKIVCAKLGGKAGAYGAAALNM